MKCYNHPHSDSFGICKYCGKGVCSACAKDTSLGLVCSQRCEQEAKSVHAMVERNRGMMPIAAKTQMRSAILFLAMAVVFIGYGSISGSGSFRACMVALGMIMFFGGAFALFNSRKIAKLQSP